MTNVVGGEREFTEYLPAWNKEGIDEDLVQQGFRWKFNPPAAPHFGVVWEQLVRSCKKAMYAVLVNRSIAKYVLSTSMQLVELNLKARPLTPVSSDVNNMEVITLNHFLLGKKMFVYHTYHSQNSSPIIKNCSDNKLIPILCGTDLEKRSTRTIERDGNANQTKTCTKVILFVWSKTVTNQ